ncbi:hypothetical protein SAMN05192583_1296 [Sphingomonas gellani]|uniref:Uncharacterized protein n=1 Tax=Sphingomonas gellani TaxID=1166340 RepID=A0A1H8BDZ4_9SPHN|nr:hypothetical protein SAMN05192583_1296 [Sphingomonas gellani]
MRCVRSHSCLYLLLLPTAQVGSRLIEERRKRTDLIISEVYRQHEIVERQVRSAEPRSWISADGRTTRQRRWRFLTGRCRQVVRPEDAIAYLAERATAPEQRSGRTYGRVYECLRSCSTGAHPVPTRYANQNLLRQARLRIEVEREPVVWVEGLKEERGVAVRDVVQLGNSEDMAFQLPRRKGRTGTKRADAQQNGCGEPDPHTSMLSGELKVRNRAAHWQFPMF